MRTVLFFLALAATAPAAAQPARPITAAEFVTRAEPLLKKNIASLMFSSEARKLAKELGAAAQAARARQEAELAAGRTPATCLPPKGKAKIDAHQLIAHLKALPPAEQQRSFQSGFANYVARKYPCPKS